MEAFTTLHSSPQTKRFSSYYARNYRKQSFLLLLMSQDNNNKDDDKQIIDATVIDSSNNNDLRSEIQENETTDRTELELSSASNTRRKRDIIRDAIKRIASLSLEDYKWRSEVFKTNEADRELEKSLARMRGEKASYLRPMDATDEDLGPLGKAEKGAVKWLSRVIEEEGNRAKRILDSDGKLIRPMDATKSLHSASSNQAVTSGQGKGGEAQEDGPLAKIERTVVNFFENIANSETERVVSGKLRPMDLDDSKRGPLGYAEANAVEKLNEIKESELMRAQLMKQRGGDVVRPVDVPGPLGEMERFGLEIVSAEKQRYKDTQAKNGSALIRPKDASIEGPLGKAEKEVIRTLDRLKEEERDRLNSIQKMMVEKRPMDSDRESLLGISEALMVGLLRAPKLFMKVVDRVKELLDSEVLSEEDQKLIMPSLNETSSTTTTSSK